MAQISSTHSNLNIGVAIQYNCETKEITVFHDNGGRIIFKDLEEFNRFIDLAITTKYNLNL